MSIAIWLFILLAVVLIGFGAVRFVQTMPRLRRPLPSEIAERQQRLTGLDENQQD